MAKFLKIAGGVSIGLGAVNGVALGALFAAGGYTFTESVIVGVGMAIASVSLTFAACLAAGVVYFLLRGYLGSRRYKVI